MPERSTVALAEVVTLFTFSSSTAMAPKRATMAGQLMQMAVATVGELASLPRQMRHGFQPPARSPRGSRELLLGFANACGRLGAEPRHWRWFRRSTASQASPRPGRSRPGWRLFGAPRARPPPRSGARCANCEPSLAKVQERIDAKFGSGWHRSSSSRPGMPLKTSAP